MKNIEVRQIHGNEILDSLYPNNTYAFSESPPLKDQNEWWKIIQGRQGVDYFALYEEGIPVSNAATSQMTQNIRGKILPAGGVWAVATRPEARRNGYCRQVMTNLFESEYENGRAVSLLYPFRGSFYERLGYVTFPQPRKAIFKPGRLAPLLKQEFKGELKVELIADGYDGYREYILNQQNHVHGFSVFDFGNKAETVKNNNFWLARVYNEGKVTGAMLYNLRGEGVMEFTFGAVRFYYLNSNARYLLLQWIARHIDHAKVVEIGLPPTEQPETWLADIRPDLDTIFIAPMGRVINLQKLSGIKTGDGAFTAAISDEHCPWNNGTWRFDGKSGSLEISKGGQADCELTIQGLSALIYGTHDPDDFEILDWGNLNGAMKKEVIRIFPRQLPFIHEVF